MKKFQMICGYLVTISLFTMIQAQIQWEKFYGGNKYEFASQLIELSDKNLLICSYTFSYGAGDADMWIVKITPSGDTIWTKTYGGSGYECATAVHELSDGCLLVAGSTGSFVADTSKCAWDVWLLKLNSKGDTIWTKTFMGSNSAGVEMEVDAQENIYLAANSSEFDLNEDAQVIKCRKDGTREWTKYFGGSDRETLESFSKTSDGSLLLLTTSQSFSPKTMWLFKINQNGEKVWDKTFGGNFRYGNASDIIEIPDGTYMMAGYNGETTETTLFFLNMNQNGIVNWQKNYDELTSGGCPTFTLLSSGNFFISSGVSLIRMDNTGKVLWTGSIGDSGVYNSADCFLETSDKKFLMLGGSNRLTKAADDLWLVSLTPDMYVDLGGTLEYHLIANADSTNYSYTMLSAPEKMTVSTGGTLKWVPPNASSFSELVSVSVKSAITTDTIGFILHVNKGSTRIDHPSAGPMIQMVQKTALIRMMNDHAIISVPYKGFKADVYTIKGSKITSLSSTSSGSVLWNLTGTGGNKVPTGRYLVRITSGAFIENVVFSVVR